MDQNASNVRRSDRVTRHRSFEVETVTHNIILIIISVERKKSNDEKKNTTTTIVYKKIIKTE